MPSAVVQRVAHRLLVLVIIIAVIGTIFARADGEPYDVIIVGAGSAGISAARTSKGYGASVLVLEAQDYVGGRTKSINDFPAVFDPGAQFLGRSAYGDNPLTFIAEQFGLTTLSSNDLKLGFLTGNELVFFASYAILFATLQARGELVKDGVVPDVTVAKAVAGLETLPYFDVALGLLTSVDALKPEIASLLDWYYFASGSPAAFLYPLNDTLYFPSGYGNLIARLSKNLPIQLNSPVEEIVYPNAPNGVVEVHVSGNRTYHAKKVIVTASMGVLQSGIIRFHPELPAAHKNAINNLPMGTAYKCALSFKKNIFAGKMGIVGNQFASFVDLEQYPGMSLFVNYFGKNMAVIIADGKLAEQFETMSLPDAAQLFLGIISKYFPGAKAAWTGKVSASNWKTNPYTQGVTAFPTVGNTAARQIVSLPVAKTIWFAGEATVMGASHSLVQGAWSSGQVAAISALAEIGLA
jgi:monoamine oxidase